MANPLVSIIVPNYNHKVYLPERLDSIFKQTFTNYEVILLDDASTDGSQVLLEKYRNHPKVAHLIINTENSGGPFKQWKKGIELAKGKYIWIAESDDIANGLFLEETVNFAEPKMDFGLVFVTSKVINAKGELQDRKFKPSGKTTGFTINSPVDISKHLIKMLAILNASGVLFNSNILKNINLKKLASFKNTGDRYAYIQVALQAPLYFLDKPLNSYRSHPLNVTKRNRINHTLYYDRLSIIEEVIPIFATYKEAEINLKTFYFEQVVISIKAGFYNKVNTINLLLYKHGLIPFKEFVQLYTLTLFTRLYSNTFPYRIGKFYEGRFKGIRIFKYYKTI